MKRQIFLGAIASLLMASCSNELDVRMNQTNGDVSPLQINVVANPISKALVAGSNFTGTAQIGVKLVDGSGSTYDGKTYNNISYGTTNGTTWTVDPSKSILLSATPGTAYAYYPYTDNASLDFTAIPISSAPNPDDQVDYMYGNVASGLKNSNPTASFTMNHAMSIVNFEIARGNYTGTGAITSIKMKGNTASNTGTMNAVAGTVNATNAGYEFESTTVLSLGSATGKFIIVPSGQSSVLDFKVVMDGQTYTASTTAPVQLGKGQVYKYTLTMNSTGLTINTVTVTAWGSEQNQGSLDTELDPWCGLADGVYAIDNTGGPVDYATANAAEVGTYQGVALVMNGRAIEIATEDASTSSKWAETMPMSDTEAAYFSAYHVSSEAAIVDMDGKANTDRILASNVTIASVINAYRTSNGSMSWYLPSAGQLSKIAANRSNINDLLTKVNRTSLSSYFYWSSSVYSNNAVWVVHILSRGLSYGDVNGSTGVRLVRDL